MLFFIQALLLFLVYLISAWIVVFWLKPKVPRNYFLALLVLYGLVYLKVTAFSFSEASDLQITAWFSALIFYVLSCFTFWNSFYSVLWGFSGGMLADFCSDSKLLKVDEIVHFYEGAAGQSDDQMNRMLLRRLPSLETGGYIEKRDGQYRTLPKGNLLARITKFLYSFFALGKGGGISDDRELS